jgi:hypothetical protein
MNKLIILSLISAFSLGINGYNYYLQHRVPTKYIFKEYFDGEFKRYHCMPFTEDFGYKSVQFKSTKMECKSI